jgi:hypothetical protein
VPARVILLLGGVAFLLYAYPGLLTLDSVDQLTEARAHFYTDAHPPAMAVLWGVLDRIIAGPFLMLLVQGATFLVGAYLVLKRALPPRAAAIAAGLVLLFPPVLNGMAFIWKDSLMAGLVLLGAGLVMSPCRRARLGALACFAVATAVKYNAFVATMPLVVLVFEWTPGARWIKRYAISSAAWLGITIVAMFGNGLLVDQPMHFWHSSLAVTDICGVIANEEEMSDDELRAALANTGLLVERDIQAHARRIYASRDFMTLVVGEQRMWDLPITGRVPAPEPQRDAIGTAWWNLVTGHPAAYLMTRLDSFLDVLGVTYKTYSAVPPRIMKHPGFLTQIGLPAKTTAFQQRWTGIHKWLWRKTPLFTQWVYIVLALVLVPLAWRRRYVLALLASGLLVEASLFFLSPSPDFRYSHWTIVCTLLAIVMLTWQRAAGPRRAAEAPDTADTPVASPRA